MLFIHVSQVLYANFIFLSRKNRRDGATVSSRVLIMTDLVGRKLFEGAASPDLEDSVDVSARQQRRKDITPSSKL